MATVHKYGSSDLVVTGSSKSEGDATTSVTTVEGPYELIAAETDYDQYVPSGMTFVGAVKRSSGNGLGVLEVRAKKLSSEGQLSVEAVRTTFRIDMCERTVELKYHPKIVESESVAHLVARWLATPEDKRADGSGKYFYLEGESQVDIANETAKKFCAAYSAGLTTFVQYDPVVEKTSVWKVPPGLSFGARGSATGGGFTDFSADQGKWDDPPISLAGYPSGHWFKSKDSWSENADRSWARTEQWTYSPEGSSGPHGWIYKRSSSSDSSSS